MTDSSDVSNLEPEELHVEGLSGKFILFKCSFGERSTDTFRTISLFISRVRLDTSLPTIIRQHYLYSGHVFAFPFG
jgi:hypothetical protein